MVLLEKIALLQSEVDLKNKEIERLRSKIKELEYEIDALRHGEDTTEISLQMLAENNKLGYSKVDSFDDVFKDEDAELT